jgi:hypothetical protein
LQIVPGMPLLYQLPAASVTEGTKYRLDLRRVDAGGKISETTIDPYSQTVIYTGMTGEELAQNVTAEVHEQGRRAVQDMLTRQNIPADEQAPVLAELFAVRHPHAMDTLGTGDRLELRVSSVRTGADGAVVLKPVASRTFVVPDDDQRIHLVYIEPTSGGGT